MNAKSTYFYKRLTQQSSEEQKVNFDAESEIQISLYQFIPNIKLGFKNQEHYKKANVD